MQEQRFMDPNEVGALKKQGRPLKYSLDDHGRDLILQKYDSDPRTTHMLARRLQVPYGHVKMWARQLGVSANHSPLWSEGDIKYLEANAHKIPIAEMSRHLGRTVDAIRIKASRLHLAFARYEDGYTMTDLMAGFGIGEHAIKVCVAKKWLRCKKQGPNSNVWLFQEYDIKLFIQQHPNELDQRRMDWLWVVDVLSLKPPQKKKAKEAE